MSNLTLDGAVLLFKALGNKARLQILNSLHSGDKNVSELCSSTGLDQARVSHELKCLVVCGLVNYRREGRYIVYAVNRDTILPIMKAAEEHVRRYYDRLTSCSIISDARSVRINELRI
ncbi:MAG: metalloregulator ArsR/SmtB family transcription factor [Nitrososphaerota archaeon]